ncbi:MULTISPECIES: hypothetical protein [Actinokineospora]|nr:MULTISPECIES: hypothetical protein [Actinokineospora]
MRSHTRFAVIVALLTIAVTALVDADALVWAAPVLPVLALLLNRTRWTELARLRVVQVAAVGQVLAVAPVLTDAPLPVAVPGLAVVCLAAAATGYGVVRFPVRR